MHAATRRCVSMLHLLKTRLHSQAKAAAAEKPVEEELPKFDSFDEVAAAGGDDDAKPDGCVLCSGWTLVWMF